MTNPFALGKSNPLYDSSECLNLTVDQLHAELETQESSPGSSPPGEHVLSMSDTLSSSSVSGQAPSHKKRRVQEVEEAPTTSDVKAGTTDLTLNWAPHEETHWCTLADASLDDL